LKLAFVNTHVFLSHCFQYAVVHANKFRYSTQAIPKSNDPVWNGNFLIPLKGWFHNSSIVVILWNKERFRKEYIGEVAINVYDLFKEGQFFHQELYNLVRLRSNGPTTSSVIGTLDLSFKLVGDVDLSKGWTEFSDTLDIEQGYQTDASEDGGDFEDSDEFNPLEYEKILNGLATTTMEENVSDATDISEDEYTMLPDNDFEENEENANDEDFVPVERTVSLLIPKSQKNLVNVPTMRTKQSRRKLGRKRVPRGYFEFNSRSSVVGVIYLEIISATDLPPMNNMTRTGFDMDPFVVVSFGKKTFRTPWKRHTLNPVFNEKLTFPVLKHEQAYSINFAVMDKDKITLNDFVASTDFAVSNVLRHAPVPDPETLLYDLDNLYSKNHSPSPPSGDDFSDDTLEKPPRPAFSNKTDRRGSRDSKGSKTAIDAKTISQINDDKMIPFELPLTLTKQKYEEKHSPKLYIKARFLPYAALRQQFWRGLIKIFDTDESDSMNFFELSELLETLGSTLSERTIISFFTRFGKHVEDNELTIDELVICLENQILNDTINQQKVKVEIPDKNLLAQPRVSTDYISGLDDDDDQEQERMIQLSACPFCNQPRLSKRAEIDIVTHLATCASQEWAVDGQLVMDKFVSSNQARKGWYSKVVSKVTYGNYRLGANSANILVQDRVTGYIQEEKMNVYVRLGIRILYKGIRSSKNLESKRARNMLKSLSIKQGRKYDNPMSTRSIPSFIKFHQLDMNEVLEPIENFKTFNEFFYRKLKVGARVLDAPNENRVLVSPADCRSTYFPTISRATEIWIKGRDFSITRLFGDAYPEYVDRFANGSLAIFRLAPQDYHRFHMPVSGVLGQPKTIEGEYYTVNPMAIRSSLDVFGENVRVLVPVHSAEFGLVMIVCVGAMMVGSTVITSTEGSHLNRMDELGYFKFGGSTLVVLFEPGRVKFDTDLVNNSSGALETLVKVGMSIGHCPSIPEHQRHDAEIKSEDIERAKTIIAGEPVN
jgi:phosphatidylserine decarboxylase